MSNISSSPSPSSRPTSRPTSLYSLQTAAHADGHHGAANGNEVDVLCLGSGWTAAFLLPRLWSSNVSFAYTNRTGVKPEWLALPGKQPIKFTMPGTGDSRIQWRRAFKNFPTARLVVVVVPLKDQVVANELVTAYQAHCVEKKGMGAPPSKWLILGSTSAYGSGEHSSASPISKSTPRSAAESAVLALVKRDAAVLHLAGLYGGSTRHPLNWLSKVADDKDKLASKGSLHLVHGRDVAEAILGVWERLLDDESTLWGRHWIVTDGRVYDWWQLATQLPSQERSRYVAWVRELQKEHGVTSLPRKCGEDLPRNLERVLDSDSFWAAIGKKPSVGPANEVDLPISPITGLAVTTDAARADTDKSSAPSPPLSGKSRPYTPSIPKARLQDLIGCLQHEIQRESTCPLPPIFEGRRIAMGLPRERFLQLRKAWLDYVTASANESNASWQGHWKEFLSYEHYFYPDERLTGKYVPGVTLDGQHFVRVAPTEETRAQRRVEPLVFLHGWPGSCLEGLFVARALANPGPDVPLSKPAFEVIVPSHPGYLFSGSPLVNEEDDSASFSGPDGDILVKDVAALINDIMLDLGFDRYSVTAGDWGSFTARRLALDHPAHVKAVHLNFIPAPPPTLAPALVPQRLVDAVASRIPGVSTIVNLPRLLGQAHFIDHAKDGEESTLSLGERLQRLLGLPSPLSHRDATRAQKGLDFLTSGSAYAQFHGTRPSTLGNITHSSPSAILSWIGEKFETWTDRTPDDSLILESLTFYFLTETMSRSIYSYRNRPPGGPVPQSGLKENYLSLPVGFSDAPFELVPPPLEWAKATANIVWHRRHENGGHFLSMEKPNDYAADVRDFHEQLQTGLK
ncbi:alpha/beta-hydrolase [Jaminaea rosea]|uniref:Alpha/beta-hydrolase n=1 Tax=Jaminaea rosea TaxID=1569628 RepID=A0A316UH90_9BASI|nr:alpha/beta-hydrolase [Jaminaea rosea]PWN24632.1 alpha/beta-hydrolase [Jaminaea rosea]